MELENIKERTLIGRMVYVQNGGRLGRPKGSKENESIFLKKKSTTIALNCLNKDLTVRQTSKIAGISVATVMKIKNLIRLQKV